MATSTLGAAPAAILAFSEIVAAIPTRAAMRWSSSATCRVDQPFFVVTLSKQAWTLPESVPFGDAQLKPLRGGETLAWRLQA